MNSHLQGKYLQSAASPKKILVSLQKYKRKCFRRHDIT